MWREIFIVAAITSPAIAETTMEGEAALPYVPLGPSDGRVRMVVHGTAAIYDNCPDATNREFVSAYVGSMVMESDGSFTAHLAPSQPAVTTPLGCPVQNLDVISIDDISLEAWLPSAGLYGRGYLNFQSLTAARQHSTPDRGLREPARGVDLPPADATVLTQPVARLADAGVMETLRVPRLAFCLGTVLVVDEDGPRRADTHVMLSRAGYATLLGTSLRDAAHLARASRDPVDLVLGEVDLSVRWQAVANLLAEVIPSARVLFRSNAALEGGVAFVRTATPPTLQLAMIAAVIEGGDRFSLSSAVIAS